VVCGVEKTESDYLEAIREECGIPALRVVPQRKGKGKDPEKVVRQAVQRNQEAADPYDEVWCVLDVDEFVLDGAERMATGAGVRLAVSNPCFELWLLLHHEDCRATLDSVEARRRLRRHVPAYDKARLDFGDFARGVEDAVGRGRRLSDGAVVGPNPSSGVWALVDMIVKEAER
jgi:hypothetical protein